MDGEMGRVLGGVLVGLYIRIDSIPSLVNTVDDNRAFSLLGWLNFYVSRRLLNWAAITKPAKGNVR